MPSTTRFRPPPERRSIPRRQSYRNIAFAPYGKTQWRALEREVQSTSRGLSAQLAVSREAAVIDYHLHQPEARREDIQYVRGLFTLWRQASDAVERRAH